MRPPLIALEDRIFLVASIITHFFLAFCGFSVFLWGIFAGAYALAFSGLVAVIVSIYAFRKSIPRPVLWRGLIGATVCSVGAVPFGLFFGPKLGWLYSYFVGAIWGIVVALVLLMPPLSMVSLVALPVFFIPARTLKRTILPEIRFIPFRILEATLQLPFRIMIVILLLTIWVGACLGAVKLNDLMNRVYDPVGGMMLFGWVAGMAAGSAIGYAKVVDSRSD